MFGLRSSVLSSFVFLAIVQAGYNIDDANATIQYMGTATNPDDLWLPLSLANGNDVTDSNNSVVLIDYGRLFNQTVTFSTCNGTQFCRIGIPFRGSGITVYGIVLDTLNFTVAIDENPAPPPDLAPPPPNTAPLVYNTSLYDLQSLPLGFHFLTLTLVNWLTGDPKDPKTESVIMFDYAHVNDTAPSPNSISTTSSTVAVPSSSAPPHGNSTKKPRSTIGIAVGTTVGAIVICAVVIFGLMRRQKTRAVTIQAIPFVAEREPIKPLRHAAPNPAQAMIPSNTNVSIPSMIFASSGEGGLSMQRDPVTSGTSPERPTTLSTARLTEEQTEFVHSLYSLSVPAPAIAQVIQRIMTETPDTSGPTSPVETQRSDLGAITAPPSYKAA